MCEAKSGHVMGIKSLSSFNHWDSVIVYESPSTFWADRSQKQGATWNLVPPICLSYDERLH